MDREKSQDQQADSSWLAGPLVSAATAGRDDHAAANIVNSATIPRLKGNCSNHFNPVPVMTP